MSEPDQQTNGLSNEPVANKLNNNNVVEEGDIKIGFEEKPDPTGQIIESVIKKNDATQKENDKNPISVIPEVVSAVVNTKPIEEDIKANAPHEVISNVVSGIINKPENNIGNDVVETSNVTPPNKTPNQKTDIEESDYDKEFYVYIIYYNNEPIPVVIGNKTTINEKLQFPIYMINNKINNKEGVDRIGYFQFDNEDGLYEDDSNNKIILNATRLTHPIFYQNIAEIIKTKSDLNNYINNDVSSTNVVQSESKVEISYPNTWKSIIDNSVTYDLNNGNNQIDNNTKLYKHEIPGDGNCFFTAVAQAFYTNGIYTNTVKIKEFLYNNLDHNKSKDNYLDIKSYYQDLYKNCTTEEKMSPNEKADCSHIKSFFEFDNEKYNKEFDDKNFNDFFISDKCWANEHLIKILSDILEITFLIHSDNKDFNNSQNNQEHQYRYYILLEYSKGNHYDLILQKTDDTYKGIFTEGELTKEIKSYFSINKTN